jgi:16S rRNA C967 or C1407 C5-methylase (RsmB/RsmF family)
VQSALLARAADLVRPGGRLVYSTCTYAPEENEAVLDDLLARRPDLSLESVSLPVPHMPGVTEWQGRVFAPGLALAARVYPHLCDSWGFFLARIRRA